MMYDFYFDTDWLKFSTYKNINALKGYEKNKRLKKKTNTISSR